MAGPVIGEDGIARCPWAVGENRPYHDDEWGRPVRGEAAVFERLTLEAFQSGLSWLIILRKRPAFREAFSGFDLETVAAYDDARLAALMEDAGIVRNRQKIEAARTNARAAVALRERGGLEEFVWSLPACRDARTRDDRAAADHLTRVPGALQGAQEGRLHVRRADHHACPHGGDRDRRHAPRGLSPAGDQRRLVVTRGHERGPATSRVVFRASRQAIQPMRALGELTGSPCRRARSWSMIHEGARASSMASLFVSSCPVRTAWRPRAMEVSPRSAITGSSHRYGRRAAHAQ